jgi:hypothetical protein
MYVGGTERVEADGSIRERGYVRGRGVKGLGKEGIVRRDK